MTTKPEDEGRWMSPSCGIIRSGRTEIDVKQTHIADYLIKLHNDQLKEAMRAERWRCEFLVEKLRRDVWGEANPAIDDEIRTCLTAIVNGK